MNSSIDYLRIIIVCFLSVMGIIIFTGCGALPESYQNTYQENTSPVIMNTPTTSVNQSQPQPVFVSPVLSATPTATSQPQAALPFQPMPATIFSSFIEVVHNEPLVFDGNSENGKELQKAINFFDGQGQFNLLGWTDNSQVVVDFGFSDALPAEFTSSKQKGTDTIWSISPDTKQVYLASEWNSEIPWNDVYEKLTEQAIETLRQSNTPVPVIRYPSPDGQYLALSIEHQIYVFNVKNASLVLTLPDKNVGYEFKALGSNKIWSNSGNYLAYPVTTAGLVSYPASSILGKVYEVHISDIKNGKSIRLALPWHGGPAHILGWSPNDEYLAVAAQFEEKSPQHIYAIRLSDLNWVDLTPDANFTGIGKSFWSPDGNMLAYTDSATNAISVMTLKY